tara:strand:- start:3638 stop:4126 length:489 start_codon:yes stop_codon:yes gene_type:complete
MNKDIPTTVIDNWLEPQLADFLSGYLYQGILYEAGHQSNITDTSAACLFGIVPLSPLTNFLIYKLKFILPIEVLRIYTNLHYPNMEGTFHSDDGDITFIYMSSKGLNSDEGHFEIKDEGKFEYKFNRLIYFDAKKLHKGNPPKQNISRVTLAFKTQSLLNKL